jgi:hypothetical protein
MGFRLTWGRGGRGEKALGRRGQITKGSLSSRTRDLLVRFLFEYRTYTPTRSLSQTVFLS